MIRRAHRRSEAGFTLPELLVAITILGIIMLAIGAMITTSFRTTTIVSAELQGSRGPKVVSRYWTPDVEQAKTVNSGGACGTGTTAIATFVSDVPPSAFVTPSNTSATTDGAQRTITWWEVAGTRDQLIRRVCDGTATPDSRVVVSDLKNAPSDGPTDSPVRLDDSAAPRYTISVTVPDRSRAAKEYTFTVTALSQLTTTTSTT